MNGSGMMSDRTDDPWPGPEVRHTTGDDDGTDGIASSHLPVAIGCSRVRQGGLAMDAELLTGDQTSDDPTKPTSFPIYEAHQQKACTISRRVDDTSYFVVCFPRSGVGTSCDLVASKGCRTVHFAIREAKRHLA